MALRLRPRAEADIAAIARHIEADDPAASRAWVLHIRGRCRRLAEVPGLGAPRFEVMDGLRLLPVGAYLILYRPVGDDLEVLRIVHGARDWQGLVR